MNEANAKRLLEGLKKQRSIYGALAQLTRSQAEVLARGETEAAVQLAASRETEMRRIEKIDGDIAEFKESWPEWRDQVPTPTRSEVQSEFLALGDTIGEIIALDKQVEDTYRAHRTEVSREIKRIDGTRRVQRAYGGQSATSPRLLDRSQ